MLQSPRPIDNLIDDVERAVRTRVCRCPPRCSMRRHTPSETPATDSLSGLSMATWHLLARELSVEPPDMPSVDNIGPGVLDR